MIKAHCFFAVTWLSIVALQGAEGTCPEVKPNGKCAPSDFDASFQNPVKCVKQTCTAAVPDSKICKQGKSTKECFDGLSTWACARVQYGFLVDQTGKPIGCDMSSPPTPIIPTESDTWDAGTCDMDWQGAEDSTKCQKAG